MNTAYRALRLTSCLRTSGMKWERREMQNAKCKPGLRVESADSLRVCILHFAFRITEAH